MAESLLRTGSVHDLNHFGLRLVVGVFFMVHSQVKFGPGFGGFLSGLGMPPEMAIPMGLLELVGGGLVVAGVASRLAGTLLAIDMLGAIIYVKKLKAFSGSQGVELELLALVILVTIVVLGPGRVSVSHAVKRTRAFCSRDAEIGAEIKAEIGIRSTRIA